MIEAIDREDALRKFAVIVRAWYAEKEQGRVPFSLEKIGVEEFGLTLLDVADMKTKVWELLTFTPEDHLRKFEKAVTEWYVARELGQKPKRTIADIARQDFPMLSWRETHKMRSRARYRVYSRPSYGALRAA